MLSWGDFPDLDGRQTLVNASTWGGTQRGFLIWWMALFPRLSGKSRIARDWWLYVYLTKSLSLCAWES
jgi:hypothetical protein